MRKLLVIILVMLLAGNAFAVKRRSLVQQGPQIGWYVAPVVKFSNVADEFQVFAGVHGGMTIDHSFYLGAAIYGTPNDDYDDDCDCHHFRDDWLDIGYGGIEMGVRSRPLNRTAFSAGMLVGGGSVRDYRVHGDNRDDFFIAEPSIDLVFLLTRSVSLGFGASYRFVDNLEHFELTNDDLSGPVFNISLGFGRF